MVVKFEGNTKCSHTTEVTEFGVTLVGRARVQKHFHGGCCCRVVGLVLLIPLLAAFITAAMGLICVDTLGWMYFWGVPLCPPSYMCIVIGIGFSVDYCSHITHTFLVKGDGTRSERAKAALREMGPSVVKGGFTTWLGMSLALFSPLEMFQFFIKPLTLGIFFGLFHGVVFIPLCCSYCGPPPVANLVEGSSSRSSSQTAAGDKHAEVAQRPPLRWPLSRRKQKSDEFHGSNREG